MVAIISAAKLTIKECQNQLRQRNWDCSLSKMKKLFRFKPKKGSRESAFLHALSSAAVVYTSTKHCSNGDIDGCKCDKSWNKIAPKSDAFQWSDCSDNVDWGIYFSRAFLNSGELSLKSEEPNGRNRSKSAKLTRRFQNKVFTNLHNNKVGRIVLKSNMQHRCACHGATGGCELTTCWRSLPAFSHVAGILRQKYDTAKWVKIRRKREFHWLVPSDNSHNVIKDTDLLYFKHTTKLCATKGRECRPHTIGFGSCENLCCGRGFEIKALNIANKCGCKFYYCCKVICDTCNQTLTSNVCK
uniref:protein Wnt-4-like n=1 Tax=Styela clava TaxID=7725 RepID=UPI00193A9341|nr:protein Wnt-4-like [Styela clava]